MRAVVELLSRTSWGEREAVQCEACHLEHSVRVDFTAAQVTLKIGLRSCSFKGVYSTIVNLSQALAFYRTGEGAGLEDPVIADRASKCQRRATRK